MDQFKQNRPKHYFKKIIILSIFQNKSQLIT